MDRLMDCLLTVLMIWLILLLVGTTVVVAYAAVSSL